MNRDYSDFIDDIKINIDKIEKFVKGVDFEAFKKDDKTNYAVVRCLEIIGEASKHIPDEIREKYPEIPWRKTAGMRDKISHFYWGIDLKIVWDVIQYDIQELKKSINEVII